MTLAYRIAWILIVNGRRASDLTYTPAGHVYSELADAIAYCEMRNRDQDRMEFVVIIDFTKQIAWQRRGSLVPESGYATPLNPPAREEAA